MRLPECERVFRPPAFGRPKPPFGCGKLHEIKPWQRFFCCSLVCKKSLQNLGGGASGQNIENTEVKALSGIFAYTASALTIICYLSFRVKVGCHMTTRKSFGPMPPLIQLRRAQLFSWVRSSIEICCWRQARSKAGPRVSSAPSGLVHFSAAVPRLAPRAAFFRRFAASGGSPQHWRTG